MTTSSPARGADWHPTRYSAPLSDEFPSHADWLLPLVDMVWRLPSGERLELDEWQRWLIRHILEVYPEGHPRAGELRYRQVVVSMGRQNGKSVLGAILALYGLVRESGALVIGVASSSEQARIIYARLLAVVKGHPSLARRFARVTDTRGISSLDGGRYEIKASKSAAVQGLDLTVGLVDELHIVKPALWSDMVNGTRARRSGLVAGITTAGDDSSTLLLELYEQMKTAGERFGYFVWEAPEAEVPDDDETFAAYVCAANPAAACGRLDIDTVVSDLRGQPDADVIRYGFNRFVPSVNVFLGADAWQRVGRGFDDAFPPGRPVFAVDRSPDWGYATITATIRGADGITWTEIVASIVKPTLGQLVALCVDLARHSPLTFAMDGYTLKELAAELRRRGLPVFVATLGDVANGSALFYSKVARRTLRHGSDPLLSVQIPRTIRKAAGDGFRISRKDSSIEIDAVMSTVLGVHVAEIWTEAPVQVF